MVRPKFVILENVAAILNNGMDIVLGELSEAGYDAEWAVISASSLGACHRRSRWWLVAYPNDNGSPSAEKSRSTEKTDGGSEERKNQTSQSQGGSEPRDTETVQRPTEFTDSDSKRSQRRLLQFNKKLQETGHIRQKDTLSSPDTDSTRTQSNRTRQAKPIWTDAFLNSKERRTLDPDWRRYVSEPCLCRGSNGLRGRMDRLKALGNSVVPQCAAIPLQRVLDLKNERQA